jgi:hypothetical protein
VLFLWMKKDRIEGERDGGFHIRRQRRI